MSNQSHLVRKTFMKYIKETETKIITASVIQLCVSQAVTDILFQLRTESRAIYD